MTRVNPSISQAEIDLALERDPDANRAEYLSEWRADVEGFIPTDVLEACVLNAPVRDDTREVQ
jgi:hypothetical protein